MSQKPEITMLYHHGLGNQMFQYALKRALQLKGYIIKDFIALYDKYDKEIMNSNFELNKTFKNLNLNIIDEDTNKWQFSEPLYEPGIYIPAVWSIKIPEPFALQGFWQTEKYFQDIREDLLEQFQFNITEGALERLGNKLAASNKPTVAIHIRRGDYLTTDIFINICTEQYYNNAIEYMKKQLGENIEFIIFSDDIEWCKEKYPDFTYIDNSQFKNYQNWYDMYLMSKCQHNIIANSSFSWWGAWLNQNQEQIVIAPDKWLNGYPTPDIWCKNWVKIGGAAANE